MAITDSRDRRHPRDHFGGRRTVGVLRLRRCTFHQPATAVGRGVDESSTPTGPVVQQVVGRPVDQREPVVVQHHLENLGFEIAAEQVRPGDGLTDLPAHCPRRRLCPRCRESWAGDRAQHGCHRPVPWHVVPLRRCHVGQRTGAYTDVRHPKPRRSPFTHVRGWVRHRAFPRMGDRRELPDRLQPAGNGR